MFPTVNGKVFISAQVDGLDKIYSILSYAAKVQEIISFSKPDKIHRERSKHIKKLIEPLSISEIRNKKVRNTIEHFSEYLDDQNKKHSLFHCSNRYLVAFNLIISHWRPIDSPNFPFKLYKTPQLQYPIYPIRVYVADERRFYNMDFSIDLSLIHQEAFEIMEHLKPYFKEESPEDWVSSMIVL